jgi:hypothetical protein
VACEISRSSSFVKRCSKADFEQCRPHPVAAGKPPAVCGQLELPEAIPLLGIVFEPER